MNLTDLKTQWQDTPQYHTHISELFTQLVNNDPELCSHRDFVEQNAFGFGERAFQYLWDLIIQDIPEDFSFCEVGVFRGQIVSLVKLLADRQGKSVSRYAVTPLSPIGIGWESDYGADIERIHDEFGLKKDYVVYKGLSDNETVLTDAWNTSPYSIVYLDGGHEYKTALFDLNVYSEMVAKGGYLVIDDCNCDMNFPPTGFFTGIDTVTAAKLKWLEGNGSDWEFIFSVVHISIFKRK